MKVKRKNKTELFFANLKSADELTSNEGICKWFLIDEIYNLEMPYTAKYVIEHYCAKGRFTSKMYVGISDGEKVEFIQMPRERDIISLKQLKTAVWEYFSNLEEADFLAKVPHEKLEM